MRLHYSTLIPVILKTILAENIVQTPNEAKQFIRRLKVASVPVDNQVRDRSRVGSWYEERTDTDTIVGECGKPEQCAFEEVLELSDKDGVNAQKIYDTYARQCWDTSVETGCNPQGTFMCINKWNDKKCVCRVGWKNGECSEDIDECLLEKEGAGKVHCTESVIENGSAGWF